jgi:hypothetical protein
MNTRLARNLLEVIRNEKHLRISLLDQDPEVADYHWTFKDAPFVAELCLMLLVALHHQVERELLSLAARAADNGQEIDRRQYQKRVEELRTRKRLDWSTINSRLKLESCVGYEAIKALRLLVNCFKHEPLKEPNEELLKLLNLDTGRLRATS